MSNCPSCNSPRTKSKGVSKLKNGEVKQRRICLSCSVNYTVAYDNKEYVNSVESQDKELSHTKIMSLKLEEVNRKFERPIKRKKKYVITSAQNDTNTNWEFFQTLIHYCDVNNAELVVIPVRYVNPTIWNKKFDQTWDHRLVKYMTSDTFELSKDIQILGGLKINATMQSPLNGLDALTRGKTTIVGHSQLQLKSIGRPKGTHPILLTTTGSVSAENYSDTRVGYIAEFNHSYSAALVELDGDVFHLRHLVADSMNGFYDLGTYYQLKTHSFNQDGTVAVILGDEHVGFGDEQVYEATHCTDGLIDTLKPEYIIRHDIFDARSISHHDETSFFKKIKKRFDATDDLETELENTIKYLIETTPEGSTSVIVSSNHDRHLDRWMDSPKSAYDPQNASIYTTLRAMKIEAMQDGYDVTDSFRLWCEYYLFDKVLDKGFVFLGQDESFILADVELGMHGDSGLNGAKASLPTYAKLGSKCVIGHRHHCGIEKGAYGVGTSTVMDLDYNKGLSSWTNTHCILYENGKRQLINIIDGQYRSSS